MQTFLECLYNVGNCLITSTREHAASSSSFPVDIHESDTSLALAQMIGISFKSEETIISIYLYTAF